MPKPHLQGCAKEVNRAAEIHDIIFSEFVEPELAEVWDYIAFDNPDAADRFLDSAFQTFNRLAQMPELGRHRAFSSLHLQDVRSFRIEGFNNYLIFYRPSKHGIEILHILHGARDLESFWKTDG